MRRRKAAFRKKKQNKFAFLLVIMAVCMIAIAVKVKSNELEETLTVYEYREASLDAQIAEEEQRAEEIEQYALYTQTTKFIEEVAREKLGLVYPGEIIFKYDE